MKVVPVTVGPDRASRVPSLDSCASTISNERSDCETPSTISTVQVTVTLVPSRTGVRGSLVTRTDGFGTVYVHGGKKESELVYL